ncbi:MAG: alpha/beta fold hydrolase [Acidiferrobacterales bacterium]|nr:alpha/beta fold hydrolase [Acidiferrobacterales bacterium]
MTLAYRRWGDGPDIALVHGWGLGGGVFDELAAELARDYCVTTVHLPGYEGSDDLPTSWTPDALAALVLELFSGPLIWIGWSLGAMIGLAAAQVARTNITKMVLIGATPRFTAAPDWPHGMSPERLAAFAGDLEHDRRGTLQTFVALQMATTARVRDLRRRLQADLLVAHLPSSSTLRAGLALLRDTDLRATIGSIEVPTLLVHGDKDRLVPLSAAAYLAARLACARLVTIVNSGHAPFLSDLPQVRRAISEFL